MIKLLCAVSVCGMGTTRSRSPRGKREKGKRKQKFNQSCAEEDFQGEALTFFCDFFSTTPNFRL